MVIIAARVIVEPFGVFGIGLQAIATILDQGVLILEVFQMLFFVVRWDISLKSILDEGLLVFHLILISLIVLWHFYLEIVRLAPQLII